jgi:zinc transporter ZupT
MSFLFLGLLFISPFLGSLAALYSNKYDENKLKLLLSFAGAYLFSITIISLMPEVYSNSNKYTGMFILAGFWFQILMEKYSKGIEHGHFHLHDVVKKHVIPFGIIASMCLHTFLEGIPLGAFFQSNANISYSILVGIALHEFPAAFALAIILKGLKLNNKVIIALMTFYCLASPIGATLSYSLNYTVPALVFNQFMAFVIGTFLHISTTILFESSEHHRFSKLKTYAVLIGVFFALLVVFIQ